MRKYNGRAASKATNVDSFLHYFYWHMDAWLGGRCLCVQSKAESLAETGPSEEITGAAMSASGLFLPGSLAFGLMHYAFV